MHCTFYVIILLHHLLSFAGAKSMSHITRTIYIAIFSILFAVSSVAQDRDRTRGERCLRLANEISQQIDNGTGNETELRKNIRCAERLLTDTSKVALRKNSNKNKKVSKDKNKNKNKNKKKDTNKVGKGNKNKKEKSPTGGLDICKIAPILCGSNLF